MPPYLLHFALHPWDDPPFHAAFARACERVRATGAEMDACATAALVEAELRHSGYSAATIAYRRTVEEALAHVAHWDVCRDGLAAGQRDQAA